MAKVTFEIEDVDGTDSGVSIRAVFDPIVEPGTMPESTAQKIGVGLFMHFANQDDDEDDDEEMDDLDFLPPTQWTPD